MKDKEITDAELYGENVTQFPKKRLLREVIEGQEDKASYVLTCGECGCTTWVVEYGGAVVCANCDTDQTDLASHVQWRRFVPDTIDPSLPDADTQRVLRFGGDLARERVVKRMNEWYKDGTLLLGLVFNENNGTTQWTGVETDKERRWVYRKLDEFKEWLGTFELNDEKESRDFADEEPENDE